LHGVAYTGRCAAPRLNLDTERRIWTAGHTHTHTYTQIYIYVCIRTYMYMYMSNPSWCRESTRKCVKCTISTPLILLIIIVKYIAVVVVFSPVMKIEKAPVFGYSAKGASSRESTRKCVKCTISHPPLLLLLLIIIIRIITISVTGDENRKGSSLWVECKGGKQQ